MGVPQHSKPLACEHGRRRPLIVQSILTDVFEGRLRPGQRLVTQELALRFGVSHTPIREALISLAGLGIIDLLPNRGAIVRRVTAREVREVYQVRRLLEASATRSACGRIHPNDLHALASELRRLAAVKGPLDADFVRQCRAADSRLHDLVVSFCGNSFLASELGRLKLLFRAFRDVSYSRSQESNDLHRLVEETGEHLAIVEALLANDRQGAMRAMARHITAGVKQSRRSLPFSKPACK